MNTSVLTSAMSVLDMIVPTRPTLDILGSILLECDGNGVAHLTSTDLDMWSTVVIPCDGVPWCGAISARYLRAASRLGGNEGELSINPIRKNAVMLKVGNLGIEAPFFPKEDYPVFEGGVPQKMKPLWTSHMDAIKSVLPDASRDNTRYIITGVFLDSTTEWRGGKGYAVSTNGKQITVAAACDIPFEGIIPAKAAECLAFLAGDDFRDGKAGLIDGPRPAGCFEVRKTWGTVVFSTRLLQGLYPRWQTVIPDTAPENTSFWETGKLLSILEPLEMVTDSIVLSISRDRCVLSIEQNEILCDPPITCMDGSTHSCCNIKFLQRVCRLFPSGVEISKQPDLGPFVARGGGITHVFMPMRTAQRPNV